MDPKGYLRRGRKSMNLIPEGFALKVVSPVYLLRRCETGGHDWGGAAEHPPSWQRNQSSPRVSNSRADL